MAMQKGAGGRQVRENRERGCERKHDERHGKGRGSGGWRRGGGGGGARHGERAQGTDESKFNGLLAKASEMSSERLKYVLQPFSLTCCAL